VRLAVTQELDERVLDLLARRSHADQRLPGLEPRLPDGVQRLSASSYTRSRSSEMSGCKKSVMEFCLRKPGLRASSRTN
jgi:hypothetical protein